MTDGTARLTRLRCRIGLHRRLRETRRISESVVELECTTCGKLVVRGRADADARWGQKR